MRADRYIELHDRECPRCGNGPFKVEQQYDEVRYNIDGKAKTVVGDAICSECGKRLEPVDLPIEMTDGWSVITR